MVMPPVLALGRQPAIHIIFFDLIKNEVTEFKIYPFGFMDTTLSHYKRLTSEESLDRIRQIMKAVKEVEGPCIGLWHNSSFTEQGEWKGWRQVFETICRCSQINEAG